MWTPNFYFRLLCLALLWMLTAKNFELVSNIKTLQSFDPYEILGVSQESKMSEIRRKYRKESLAKHPDKNKDNPLAVQEFIRLTKAYRILTDDTARENFQKYGNPDGPGSYNVGIALPRVLLDKENHVVVLLSAFTILLVIIPGYVYTNFGGTISLDEFGIHTDNRMIFGHHLNENLLMKNLPQLIGRCKELQEMRCNSKEETDMVMKLGSNPDVHEMMPKQKSKSSMSLNPLPMVLIIGQLLGLEEINHPCFAENLDTVRRTVPLVLNTLNNVAMELISQYSQQQTVKKITFRNIQTLIKFKQHFTQGLWRQPLMQLPHFDEDVIKRLKKRRVDLKIGGKNDIREFVRLPIEKIREMDLFEGDKERDEKQLDLEAVVAHMPKVTCSVSVYTELDELVNGAIESVKTYEPCASDFVKVEFRIKYEHIDEDDTEGYVYSNNYPYLKKHSWHIVMIDAQTGEKVFMNAKKLRADERLKKPKDEDYAPYDGSVYMINKQRIGRAGEFPFHVHFMSDSYMGFDEETDFQITTKEDPDVKEFEYSKEDKRAVEGNGGIQALFAEEDNEFDSDSEQEEEHLTQTEKLKKRLEEAGMEESFKGREGSGVSRPKDKPKKVEAKKATTKALPKLPTKKQVIEDDGDDAWSDEDSD